MGETAELENAPFENPYGYDIAIEEMRFRLSEQYHSIEVFTKFGRQMLTAASLVMAIGSALQLFNVTIPKYVCLFNSLMVIAMLLYAGLLGLSLWMSLPVKVYGPTDAIWNELWTGFVNQADNISIQKQRLSNYVDVIHNNKPIIEARKWTPTVMSMLLGFIVFIFMFLSLFPRWPL